MDKTLPSKELGKSIPVDNQSLLKINPIFLCIA